MHSKPFLSQGILRDWVLKTPYFIVIMSLREYSYIDFLPIPVLPINFFRIPFPLKVYITIYILISYKDFKKGFSPPNFNWKIWNWKISG